MKTRQMRSFCLCPACRVQSRRAGWLRFALAWLCRVLMWCAILVVLEVLMLAALIYVANTAPTLQ